MLATALLVLAVAAAPEPTLADEVLAEGDGVRITAAEYSRKMSEQSPFIRQRYTTVARRREFLDSLIKFQVMAQEARRRGLDRDPDVQATTEKVMVQKLVQLAFSDADAPPPSEAELRAAYEAHRDEYQRPAKVRVALRAFPAPAGGGARARAEREARALLARLQIRSTMEREEPGEETVTREQAAEREPSPDPAAVAQLADQGFHTREELATLHGEPVAAAAFASADDGNALVVGTTSGFFVLRVTGRQEALERSFDQVREQLAARLWREGKTRAFDALVGRLRAEARVQVNDAALERIVVK